MSRITRTIIVGGLTTVLSLSLVCHQTAWGVGRGGGGGGGGGRGGGIGGGGGGARPAAPAARPSAPPSRPSAPAARPSTPPSRPNVGSAPSFGGSSRPDVGNASRPSTGGSGNRPSVNPGSRPELGTGSANRPAIGQGSTRPGGDRPQAGTLPGTRPGIGTGTARPGTGIANRPNTLPGMDNRLPNSGNRLPNGGATVQDRRNDLNERFQDRGNWQNNRQDYQNNRREDWQNWANANNNHGDWYHGYSYGGWWNHGWENHPGWMAFGMTTWGLNRLAWGFGLGAYSNPYYAAPVGGTPVYNYSQPIVQQDPVYDDAGAPIAAPAASDAGMSTFDQARADFYAGNYASALDNINATLKEMPNDAVVHEFRALVLFALGRYNEAAATIHPVLAVGPGWDWPTLVGLYPSVDVYTDQLRNLENYVKANPNAADALFLMAYHYLTCDHKDAAHKTFEKVVSLQPNDTVAAQYVQLTNPESQADAPTPEPPAAAEIPASKLLTEKDLVGKWKAAGPNGTTFNLEMTDQGQFTWAFTQGKNTQSMKGVFAIDRNQLALQPDSGGTMLADLTKKDSGFHFAMEGAPDKDPGLNFTK